MTTAPAARTALVGTRKGLFVYDLDAPRPTVAGTHFLGSPVSSVLCDVRDGAWYACLDHGHFGVKLHRSDDHGCSTVRPVRSTARLRARAARPVSSHH